MVFPFSPHQTLLPPSTDGTEDRRADGVPEGVQTSAVAAAARFPQAVHLTSQIGGGGDGWNRKHRVGGKNMGGVGKRTWFYGGKIP